MLDCTKILQIPYEGMGYVLFVSVDTILMFLIYEMYKKKKKKKWNANELRRMSEIKIWLYLTMNSVT